MGQFLDLLKLELSMIEDKDLYEPEAEVETQDHQVGTLPPTLKKLFTYSKILNKEGDTLGLESKYSRDNSAPLYTRSLVYKAKAQAVLDLFWSELREEFSLWNKPSVGVRKGYIVVWGEGRDFPGLGFLFGRSSGI